MPGPGRAEDNFQLVKVAEDIHAAVATEDGLATGNAGVIIGDNGILVVDSFFAPGAATQLIAEIARRSSQPIRYLVNTHYHLDHTGGNQIFAARHVPIIGQANLRRWIPEKNKSFISSAQELRRRHTELSAQWQQTPPSQREDLTRRLRQVEAFLSLQLTPPTITFQQEGMRLYLGRREVVLFTLPGHTGGDTVVYVPDANVLFTGDLGWVNTIPHLGDAQVHDWITSLDKLLREYPTARFVPGHGPVGTAAQLAELRDYLYEMRVAVQQAIAKGLTLEQAQEQIKVPAPYQHYAHQHLVPRNVADLYAELTRSR